MVKIAIFLLILVQLLLKPDGVEGRTLQKRSDDPNPLQAVVEHLSQQLEQLQAQFDTRTQEMQAKIDSLSHHVAFLAQFSGTTASVAVPHNSPYRFDQVILNQGHGYDPVTGMFTAPVSGVYSFSVQIFLRGGQRSVVDILLNGKIVSRMSLDTITIGSNGEDSDSTTVIVQLQAGDRVWVRGAFDTTYFGDHHTFFTGSLLYTV